MPIAAAIETGWRRPSVDIVGDDAGGSFTEMTGYTASTSSTAADTVIARSVAFFFKAAQTDLSQRKEEGVPAGAGHSLTHVLVLRALLMCLSAVKSSIRHRWKLVNESPALDEKTVW